MSFGPIIDVAIGLIFLYLLLGLIVTAAQELIAGWLNLRGKTLRDAIVRLVGDGNQASPLFATVFGHTLVNGASADRLPSYVPSRNFALALIDTLSRGGQAPIFVQFEQGIAALPTGKTRDALELFVRQAGGDLDALSSSIATWYDDAMDRVSGAYKLFSQRFSIIIGLILAILLNVNSIRVAEGLWRDDALRANVAAAATVYSAEHPSVAGPQASSSPINPTLDQSSSNPGSSPVASTNSEQLSNLNSSISDLENLKLPIGWDLAVKADNGGATVPNASFFGVIHNWLSTIPDYFKTLGWGGFARAIPSWIVVAVGWVITGAAVSLGAPFWFDMLGNILNIRGTGPKPPRADADEAAS